MSKRSASSAGGTVHQTSGSSPARLSMRSGAIAVRTVNRFLAAAKNASHASSRSANETKGKSCHKKMSEKDAYKCSPKIMEAAKRDTLLSRYSCKLLFQNYTPLCFLFTFFSIGSSCVLNFCHGNEFLVYTRQKYCTFFFPYLCQEFRL